MYRSHGKVSWGAFWSAMTWPNELQVGGALRSRSTPHAVVAQTGWCHHRCPPWCWLRDCHACWRLVQGSLQKDVSFPYLETHSLRAAANKLPVYTFAYYRNLPTTKYYYYIPTSFDLRRRGALFRPKRYYNTGRAGRFEHLVLFLWWARSPYEYKPCQNPSVLRLSLSGLVTEPDSKVDIKVGSSDSSTTSSEVECTLRMPTATSLETNWCSNISSEKTKQNYLYHFLLSFFLKVLRFSDAIFVLMQLSSFKGAALMCLQLVSHLWVIYCMEGCHS